MPKREIIIPIGPSIAYVPLTKNQFALIDIEDAERVGRFCWQARKHRRVYYAGMGVFHDGMKKTLEMQRFILPTVLPLVCDHINRNPLDNRRSNLRAITNSENLRNASVKRTSKSGFKGVTRQTSGRWHSYTWNGKKQIYHGTYDTPEEAAAARG